MEKEIKFAKQSFGERLKSMLKVDFKRMFVSPLFYIMVGISLVMPVLILIMTSMMGGSVEGETVQSFTNVWQAISTVSGEGSAMGMDIVSMCNINLIYFISAILVCLFVSDDFKSGYSKNLFTVRAKKNNYVISKSIVLFVAGASMLIAYFIGAMIGGGIAGLSFDLGGVGVGGIIMCMLSKILLMAVFVSIFLTLSVIAKQRSWLSILLSFGVGMLLFMMIPMMTPLNATFLNVIMCLAGGAMFGFGLGALSILILNKRDLL